MHCSNKFRALLTERITFAVLSVFMGFLLMGASVVEARNIDGMKGPITITADRLETYNDGELVIFSGRVTARQGKVTVDSDQLRIYYRPGGARGDAATGGGIEKIEAEGMVEISDESAFMTGDHAVLHYGEQTVVMTGDRAVLREGENVVEGGRITWLLTEGRGVVEDMKRGRVTATIQTGDE